MVRGRIETTPSEQLVALRKARDHYVALADRLKIGTDGDADLEDRRRERDARRIAKAYDKSIANMAAKMVRAGAPGRTVSFLNNLGMARPAFAVAVCSLAILALVYPGLFETRQVRADIAPAPTAAPLAPLPAAVPKPIAVTPGPKSPESRSFAAKLPKSPAPSLPQKPGALRSTAVAEQIRPMAPRIARAKKTADSDEDGFIAKVLQPDGTLKEEFFSSAPR